MLTPSDNTLCYLQELFYIAPSHLLIFKTFFYFVLIAHLLSCLLLGIGSLRRLNHCSDNFGVNFANVKSDFAAFSSAMLWALYVMHQMLETV
jgi:hypothetical protein